MHHEDWLDRAREALDESARDLDGATASRLNQARQAALATRRRWSLPVWGALAASALTMVVAVGLWLRPGTEPVDAAPVAAQDFEMLTAEAELDMLADLEFYLWLEEELPEEASGDEV